MASIRIFLALSLLFLLNYPAFSKTTCKKSMTFFNKQTFDNCIDLPTLNAVLHWTYNPSQSTLSMAFTAPHPAPNGWVAWALNPNATGMVGAQSLIAFKPTPTGPITVNTYDISSYHDITKGPISYNVTGLSAEESSGKITVFATWVIPEGETSVNQVWQVGPVVNGKLGKHDFEQANLESKMKLDLVDGPASGPAGAPVEAPAGAPTGESGGRIEASAPATVRQSSGAGEVVVVSVVLGLGALLVSLF